MSGTARIRVLIAESDSDTLETLALHLRNEEYEVIPTADGDEAIEIARQDRPDLLIVDVGLSMGTVSLHEHLAEFPDVAAIPTLYLVGRRSPDSTAEKRRSNLPSTVTIEKPVAISELLAKVADTLSESEDESGSIVTRQRVA